MRESEMCHSSDPKGRAHADCERRKGHEGLCCAFGQSWDPKALPPKEMRRWMKVVEDASGFRPNRVRLSDGEYYLTKRGTIGRRVRANS